MPASLETFTPHWWGEDRATFVGKLVNLGIAVSQPRKSGAKSICEQVRTATERQFFRNRIAVKKNLTGQSSYVYFDNLDSGVIL